MSDFEKLGSFYLGRMFDQKSGQTTASKVLYDADDLTTHAVCVGMTGSGKTGLCLSLIEEAALDGIPIIAIDPKGDLGNLLLAFPNLLPADFEPWVDSAVARQKGISAEQLAGETAALWKQGLADWDESGERIARFNSAVDKVIYTPGSTAGLPLTVLKGFHAPPPSVVDDVDTYNDLVQSTTQGVLALVGINADPVKSREAILIANILNHSWRAGKDLDLPQLIRDIQRPPFDRVGIVDLENFIPAKDRLDLGMKINNLLASPSFASWLEGEALDVQKLLYTDAGQPRLSILSIAHLNDAERMFFVTILLNEILSWMRAQPGTSNLRAILYMDEVFGYFPPTANPPSKQPMLTLMKQARAYGLGVVLATQNPVDLDYKGLANAGTWFLGRLQTERDKLRVLEGLEGASIETGTLFNRQEMDTILSGLRNRVFLVNNVHANGPILMHTRWAMSYLRGPLTRDQIRTLMKNRKDTPQPDTNQKPKATAAVHADAQPMLSSKIVQKFWPVGGELPYGLELQYRPGLVATVVLSEHGGADDSSGPGMLTVVQEINDNLPVSMWSNAKILVNSGVQLLDDPPAEGKYAALSQPLSLDKSYSAWQRDLQNWFDARQRTAKNILNQIEKAKDALEKAELDIAEYRLWWLTGLWSFFSRAAEIAIIRFTGGRTRKQVVTATATNQVCRGRRALAVAKAKVAELRNKLNELEAARQREAAGLATNMAADPEVLEAVFTILAEDRADVGRVSLVWLPWAVDPAGQAKPLY